MTARSLAPLCLKKPSALQTGQRRTLDMIALLAFERNSLCSLYRSTNVAKKREDAGSPYTFAPVQAGGVLLRRQCLFHPINSHRQSILQIDLRLPAHQFLRQADIERAAERPFRLTLIKNQLVGPMATDFQNH